jgi:GNAT superfamily N-acetyltransferase
VTVAVTWRGEFTSTEVNRLHAECFETPVASDDGWDWERLCVQHSLGWVTARASDELVGFANVLWDGLAHAWLQDVMVAASRRHAGIGTWLVATARAHARQAGCEWLHVDFDEELAPFYLEACGFSATPAGLVRLEEGTPQALPGREGAN